MRTTKPGRRFGVLVWAALVWGASLSVASAVPVADSDELETSPAVAYNHNSGGMLVYQRQGRILGQRLDASGNRVGGTFQVFPPPWTHEETLYANPDIGFHPGSGEFVVAAQESTIITIGEAPGALPMPSGIVVSSYAANGERQAIRWLASPTASPGHAEARPVVATDEPGVVGAIGVPMLAVAWEDPILGGSFVVQRLSSDLSPISTAQRVPVGDAERVHNLAVSNARGSGRHAFVMDVVDRYNRRSVRYVSVPHAPGIAGADRLLALRSAVERREAPPMGRPDIAFVPSIREYAVVWSDDAGHFARRIRASGTGVVGGPVQTVGECGGILLFCARALAGPRLRVLSARDGSGQLLRGVSGSYFGAGFVLRPYSALQLWKLGPLDGSSVPAFGSSIHSAASADFDQAAVALEPAFGRAVAVYEQTTPRRDLISEWVWP